VDDDKPRIMLSEDEILRRVDEIAAEISSDYADKGNVVLIGVLKGSFIFLADLSRRLTIPRTVDFIAVSSYGSGSISTGAVRMLMDVRTPLVGRHVILVEDIVDTGHTLKYLMGVMESHNAASVRTCTLLHKPSRSEVDVPLDYVGFTIPDEWVVGYGLDYGEKGRTLPYIGIIEPDDG
jgi:hypoxanthine phosphoribosyltransferase